MEQPSISLVLFSAILFVTLLSQITLDCVNQIGTSVIGMFTLPLIFTWASIIIRKVFSAFGYPVPFLARQFNSTGWDCINSPQSKNENDLTAHAAVEQKNLVQLQNIYCLFLCIIFFCLVPSLFLPVANRVHTSQIICEILSIITVHIMLFISYEDFKMSPEHLCYVLQFCCTYLFFYILTVNKKSTLCGAKIVNKICKVCMYAFPFIFSLTLYTKMHLSPYAFIIIYSGEICHCSASVIMHCVHSLIYFIDYCLHDW